MFRTISLLTLLLMPAALIAQSPRSATGGEANLWVGAEFSNFNPDWSCPTGNLFTCQYVLLGPTAFVDLNLGDRWGGEGEARWLEWHGNNGQVESNYLIGPRYRLFRYHRLKGWAKLELGGGWITTPGYPQAGSLKGSYFAYVPGGTLEYPLTHRLSLRGDYEYQIWPSFAGPPTYTDTGTLIPNNHGLTPNGLSVGVTYRIMGR